MGFNPPVPQQDSNWEIRVAVLLSLMFQVILTFTGSLRKRSSCAFFRFVIWSCYLLADWVADLALGLLLNNMGNIGGGGGGGGGGGVGSLAIPSMAGLKHVPHGDTATSGSAGGGGACSGGSSPIIFAFWAPFLLLHMGGPDKITAYSLEDNELWLRHFIGFLFELSAALVVFFCSLEGNPMIVATPIILVAGMIKYIERTYSLYHGSTNGFTVAILGVPDVRPANIPRLMQAYSSKKKGGLIVELATLRDSSNVVWDINSGEDEGSGDAYDGEDELNAYNLFTNYRTIFVNGVVSTRNRKMSEDFYCALRNPMKAFDILEMELNYMYDVLYTKMPILNTMVGCVLRIVTWCCIISSFIIFAHNDRAGMPQVDIVITYALLAIAVALEAVALVMLLFSNWALVYVHHSQHSKWLSQLVRSIHKTKKYWRAKKHSTCSRTICQMNLIDHSLNTVPHDNQYGFFQRKVADVFTKISHKPILGRIKKGEYENLLSFIFKRIQIIAENIKKSGKKREAWQDRGGNALRELVGCFKEDKRENIESNIIFQSVSERDFDESLLIWHIATDVCFSLSSKVHGLPERAQDNMPKVSKCISEYLLYLLIKKPEMTSATMGIGHLRYNNTYEGAKLLFRPGQDINNDQVMGHVMACRMVHSMDTTTFKDGFIKGDRTKTVLFNASILAKALMNSFTDEDEMWKVIAHVWMEMLTFTASHTQPREHLRKLSNGGELITMVWLLMAHMGMTSSLFEVQETESINKLIIHDQ